MTAFDTLWPTILEVGRNAGTGGYRRFAWSDADLTLREWFTGCAESRGMDVEVDRNGNMWAWWMPPGWTGDPRGAFVTGSHLDSVPDGGAFDGPLGVVSAFSAIDIVRERGVVPTIPVAVVAFSDEEGARFGVACVGSQLSTGALSADRARGLRDIDGITLAEALARIGRDPQHLGEDPHLVDRVGVFIELHVEQGRALDLVDAPLAVASAIWPHGRWEFTFSAKPTTPGRPVSSTAAIPCSPSRRRFTPRGPRPLRTTPLRPSARSSSHPTGPTRFHRRSVPGWTPGRRTRQR